VICSLLVLPIWMFYILSYDHFKSCVIIILPFSRKYKVNLIEQQVENSSSNDSSDKENIIIAIPEIIWNRTNCIIYNLNIYRVIWHDLCLFNYISINVSILTSKTYFLKPNFLKIIYKEWSLCIPEIITLISLLSK
jgi:hypothetical protein